MSDYIQSNDDSSNLALYAGIGLAGAAGGAALAYRMTRDPSSGETTATGKGEKAEGEKAEKAKTEKAASAETAQPEKKKMGFLGKILRTNKSGASDGFDGGTTTTTVPESAVPEEVVAKAQNPKPEPTPEPVHTPDPVHTPKREPVPYMPHVPSQFPNVNGTNPTNIPLTQQATLVDPKSIFAQMQAIEDEKKRIQTEHKAQSKAKEELAREQTFRTTLDDEELHKIGQQYETPTRHFGPNNAHVTSTEALTGIDLGNTGHGSEPLGKGIAIRNRRLRFFK